MSWTSVPAASGSYGEAVHPQTYVDTDYVVSDYITDDLWLIASSSGVSYNAEADASSTWGSVTSNSVGWA